MEPTIYPKNIVIVKNDATSDDFSFLVKDFESEEALTELLEEMFVPEHERFSSRKEIDARKLIYQMEVPHDS